MQHLPKVIKIKTISQSGFGHNYNESTFTQFTCLISVLLFLIASVIILFFQAMLGCSANLNRPAAILNSIPLPCQGNYGFISHKLLRRPQLD
jgi:hypothetical protein